MVSALSRFGRIARSFAILALLGGVVMGAVGAVGHAGTASAVDAVVVTPAPRLLPAMLPDGLGAGDVGNVVDRLGPSSAISYVHLLRDPRGTQQFFVVATPYDKVTYENSVTERKSSGATSISVHGRPATLVEDGGSISIQWFEGKTSVLVDSDGVSKASALAFAIGVVPTKKPDASFALRRRAVGFVSVYVGPISQLSSSASSVSWENNDRSKRLTLNVAEVVPTYIDIVYLGPGSAFQPTSIRGKPAYISLADGQLTLLWMEQPTVLVELTARGLEEGVLRSVAESLQTVSQATWESRTRS